MWWLTPSIDSQDPPVETPHVVPNEIPLRPVATISDTGILFIGPECWKIASKLWEGPTPYFEWTHPQYPYGCHYRKYFDWHAHGRDGMYSHHCTEFNYEVVPNTPRFSFGGGIPPSGVIGPKTQRLWSPGKHDGKMPAPYVFAFLTNLERFVSPNQLAEAVIDLIEPFKTRGHTCAVTNILIVDPGKLLDKKDNRFAGCLIQEKRLFHRTGLLPIGGVWERFHNEAFVDTKELPLIWGQSKKTYGIVLMKDEFPEETIGKIAQEVRKSQLLVDTVTLSHVEYLLLVYEDRNIVFSVPGDELGRRDSLQELRDPDSLVHCDKILGLYPQGTKADRYWLGPSGIAIRCESDYWFQLGLQPYSHPTLSFIAEETFRDPYRNLVQKEQEVPKKVEEEEEQDPPLEEILVKYKRPRNPVVEKTYNLRPRKIVKYTQ